MTTRSSHPDSCSDGDEALPEKRQKTKGTDSLVDTQSTAKNRNGQEKSLSNVDTTKANNILDLNQPIPQLAGITEGDLQTAIRVLDAVAALDPANRKRRGKQQQQQRPKNDESSTSAFDEVDTLELYKQANLRPFRKSLAACLELHKRTMFQGKPEEEHYEQRQQFRSLKRQKMAESVRQQRYLAETQLRKGRVERLQKLKDEAKEEEMSKVMALMIPDGHVDTAAANQSSVKLLQNGKDDGEKMSVENVDSDGDDDDDDETDMNGIKLPKLRSCYVCKIRFRELHHFYDQLCPTCAPLNWEKRHQTADLTNRVAIVTGARVKIGYQTCLKLLRAGATVVATTRFPNSATNVYRQEADFDQWKHRLQVYGLDLRDVTGLEAFTRFLKMKFPNGIDMLINNACQTVRRPRAYYLPLVEQEQTLWQEGDVDHKSVLAGCADFERVRHCLLKEQMMMRAQGTNGSESSTPLLPMAVDETVACDPNTLVASSSSAHEVVARTRDSSSSAPFESTGLSHSTAMSQMIILPEDVGISDTILPPGISDINGQQLDLRTTNSWLLKMEEVSTPEILECMFVNAVAPFVLNSRLKPLMTTPQDDAKRPDRFIINVSAMEGKFYRYKLPNHPHTNMAKAALNMLTRTSAEDLATKHRIYMNSVDTGWINDENPLERASKTAKTNLFQTPIDEIDAAARILDPIFTGVNGGRECQKDHGKFLKDYRETEW